MGHTHSCRATRNESSRLSTEMRLGPNGSKFAQKHYLSPYRDHAVISRAAASQIMRNPGSSDVGTQALDTPADYAPRMRAAGESPSVRRGYRPHGEGPFRCGRRPFRTWVHSVQGPFRTARASGEEIRAVEVRSVRRSPPRTAGVRSVRRRSVPYGKGGSSPTAESSAPAREDPSTRRVRLARRRPVPCDESSLRTAGVRPIRQGRSRTAGRAVPDDGVRSAQRGDPSPTAGRRGRPTPVISRPHTARSRGVSTHRRISVREAPGPMNVKHTAGARHADHRETTRWRKGGEATGRTPWRCARAARPRSRPRVPGRARPAGGTTAR